MSVSPCPAVGNELFVHNMRALWRVDAPLAGLVDEVAEEERLPLEPTRSGDWTARGAAPDGSRIYLHSRYDPRAEARQFVDTVPLADKYCFVISGLGLGYHVRALLDRLTGDRFVVVSEPSAAVISTALCCVDFHDAIASQKLILLVDDDKSRLHERLKDRSALVMLGVQISHHAPSMRVASSAHAAITRSITDFVTYTHMTLTTLVSNARITCRNIAMNLRRYVTTPPLEILRDRFHGVPAVVISAGPSLHNRFELLRRLQGRAVLCAVQTTLQPLLAHGIRPDFVTSLDYHEMSRKFFDDLGDVSDIHLVAEPKATWHVVDGYGGPVSLLDNHWARLLIGDALGARDGLKAGATVAHLAFYLAVYLGCDPIILVGQDLAYSGHVYYVPGVEIHRAWRSELNRFNTMEMKEWDRIVRNRPILRQVESVNGSPLYTDELLFTYLEQFETDIAATPRQVINASEGGARICGTVPLRLEDVLERYCRRPIDPERFAYRRTTRWYDVSRLPAAAEQLGLRLAELDAAIDVCETLLSLFAELSTLIDHPAQFNQRLVRVDELRAKVYSEARAYQLLSSFTQHAELRRFSADRRLTTESLSDADRAKRQLERDTEFITAIREGARELQEILRDALARLKADG